MRSKEIECRIDAPVVIKDSKILVRPNQSSAGYLPPEAAGVTERLRLIAIRLAATELLRRGSLLGDVHESPVAALLHIATTPFSDHSIQCRLHHRPDRRADDLDVVLKGSGRLSAIKSENFVELGRPIIVLGGRKGRRAAVMRKKQACRRYNSLRSQRPARRGCAACHRHEARPTMMV